MTGLTHDSEIRLNQAIAARALGTPYHEVLDRFGVTSSQFFNYVMLSEFFNQANAIFFLADARRLPEFRGGARQKKRLEEVVNEEDKRKELFIMEDRFLKQQYVASMKKRHKGEHTQLPLGALIPFSNRKIIVYHALTLEHPLLSSTSRERVIYGITGNDRKGIEGLPYNLVTHFAEIGLGSIMQGHPLEGLGVRSPLTILGLFDLAFQDRTGNPSLYSLKHSPHLHQSRDHFRVRSPYFEDHENAKNEAYHFLTVHNGPYNEALSSRSRRKVVDGINKMAFKNRDLYRYFESIGLRKLAESFEKGKKNSPIAVLEVFDEAYGDISKDPCSLFDTSQRYHIKVDGRNRIVTPDQIRLYSAKSKYSRA